MKVIVEVKDTATLDRIDQLRRHLEFMSHPTTGMPAGFSDVINKISKEW